MRRLVVAAAVAFALVAAGRPAWAQSRPLVTEDPETVPSGKILFETGIDFSQDTHYPASGLRGNLWRIGTFGVSFGVSPIAEIQLDGGIHNRLAIKGVDPLAPLASMLPATAVVGTATGDFEDLVFGAKIRLAPETASRPSLAFRFSTRLPNAGNESGLGLDTTDFNLGFAAGKTVQSTRIVGNLGVGILGDPTRGDRQNDVVNFGMSMAKAVRTGVEVVGEINGRLSTRSGTPPPGTESRSAIRLGTRLTHGLVRLDAAVFVGVTADDPTWGFTLGGTWVFKAFEIK